MRGGGSGNQYGNASTKNIHWNYDIIFTKCWNFYMNKLKLVLELLLIILDSNQPYPAIKLANETNADLTTKWTLL